MHDQLRPMGPKINSYAQVEAAAGVRSGLCHGPACEAEITDGSASEDFCSDACQTAWHATLTHPPMPPVSIHLPAPSLARWTPEGGAPVTPETSTWEPTRVSWVPTIADPEHPTTAELMGGVRLDGLLVDGAPIELEPPSPDDPPPTPATGGWVQLDDSDHPDWVWRADVTERIRRASTAELFEALRTCKLKVKRSAEVGEAATQSPTKDRSWRARLWGWMWLRG